MNLRCAYVRADAAAHGARLPERAHGGASAGYDLFACLPAPVAVPMLAEAPVRVPTGLAMAIPAGHVGLILPRSSTGEAGLRLANTAGVIDSDYRGEILILCSAARPGLVIAPGQKIAQLLILPVPYFAVELLESLDETARGAGGFGSTG